MPHKLKFYIHSIIASLVFTIMCVVAWYVFSMIADMSVKTADVKRDLAVLDLKRNQIQEITKRYESAKGGVAELDQVFLDRKNKLSFIKLVEDLAVLHGVSEKIEASDDLPVKKDQKGQIVKEEQTVPFGVTVTGPFPNALRFIEALEQSRYFINIETAQIARSDASPGGASGEIQAKLIVNVYTQ